jgi:hypothetical protein
MPKRQITTEIGQDLRREIGQHRAGEVLTWDVPERDAELHLQVFEWGECISLVAWETGEILMHMDVRI